MEEEMYAMTDQLKEQGLVTFLREFLSSSEDGATPNLRKLLLGFGVIPVRDSGLKLQLYTSLELSVAGLTS